MLSVCIFKNKDMIYRVNAVNVTEKAGSNRVYGTGEQLYRLNILEDKIIKHNYEDGAIKLAIKMLNESLNEKDNLLYADKKFYIVTK